MPASIGSGKAITGSVFALSLAWLMLRAPTADFYLESTDLGYQLALGAAVAAGRWPGLDFITQYGPAVALSSWAAWGALGSVLGEVVLCAAGYAAAIALAAGLVRREAGNAAAMAVGLVLLVAFPRFYKWYYWLWPLVGLAFAVRHGDRPGGGLRAAWGLSVGVAFLFRYDLGLEGLVFGLVALALARPAGLRRVAAELVGWTLLLPLFYPAVILATRGPGQALAFLHSIADGATDSIDAYGIAPFAFDAAHPVSAANALAALQVLLPLMCLAAVVRGPGYLVRCAGLTALGVWPQALHRADVQHLLQVLPADVMVLALLARSRPRVGPPLALGVAVLVAMLPGLGADLAPLGRNPVRAWRELAGLPASRPDNAVADMAAAIDRELPPGATVFLAMPMTQTPMLAFARRAQPGLFPLYEPGMFDGPYWRARNRALLLRAPPDALVVPAAGSQAAGEVAPYLADVSAAWRATYTRVLHGNGRFVLLVRP